MSRHSLVAVGAALALVIGAGTAAEAAFVTFTGQGTGSEGAALEAKAEFQISDATLTIILTNIASSDNTTSGKDVPGNTLTGVFFDLLSHPALTLTPGSATINAGTLIQADRCDTTGLCNGNTTNVGGEFRYDTGVAGRPHYGIASSGYIGGDGNFNGPDLDGPAAVNGINFGLVSINDLSFTPNGGLEKNPLIKGPVTFTLTGVSGVLTSEIANVWFQYGTSLSEANFCVNCPKVPEPASLVLLGGGLLGLVIFGWVRRRRL